MIAIVDLGIGNLANVKKAVDGKLTRDPYDIERAEKIILPGVGSFGAVAKNIENLRDAILDAIDKGTQVLGICLGLHLLFERSEESSKARGLGIFRGDVRKLNGIRVPHIGWNQVWQWRKCPLLKEIRNGAYFYFVHSYYVIHEDKEIVHAVTDYVTKKGSIFFPSVVCRENVYGVQFHPEKSGSNGLRFLKNFRRL